LNRIIGKDDDDLIAKMNSLDINSDNDFNKEDDIVVENTKITQSQTYNYSSPKIVYTNLLLTPSKRLVTVSFPSSSPPPS
jgi:hypothetical protein